MDKLVVLCNSKLVIRVIADDHSNQTAYLSTEDSVIAVQWNLFENIGMKLRVLKSQIIDVVCYWITHRSVTLSTEPATDL